MAIIENPTFCYFLMIIISPTLALLTNLLFFKNNFIKGSQIATLGIWIGFLNAAAAWVIGLPFSEKSDSWGFIANEVTWLMAILILFISAIVHQFSLRYMAGDRNYRRYYILLGLITVSALLIVASDNFIFLVIFWSLSNALLVLLMIHKSQWSAAKSSGYLAAKTFMIGFIFLAAGLALFAYDSGTFSLHLVIENQENLSPYMRKIALLFIILAAFSQSGIWPFHSWLISSLNSPTPVSAFMHAGLVNGGGLLIVRFAPIFIYESMVLDILFILGVISLILGGIWKLLQSSIKRMLACSTMTQMGFTMMQCGLGLFPAALAHLIWHGLFKAFLFLRSGSAIAEHHHHDEYRISDVSTFLLSSFCGVSGALGFIFGNGLQLDLANTTFLLVLFAWMASSQFAHTLLQKAQTVRMFLIATILSIVAGTIYGISVSIIEKIASPLHIWQPQQVHVVHIIAIALVFLGWVVLNLKPFKNYEGSIWWRSFYVKMLNASQPNPTTTTTGKDGYQF